MSIEKIIRAWKDADYRESLSAEERAALPEHPSGLISLSDADLAAVAGATVVVSDCDACQLSIPVDQCTIDSVGAYCSYDCTNGGRPYCY